MGIDFCEEKIVREMDDFRGSRDFYLGVIYGGSYMEDRAAGAGAGGGRRVCGWKGKETKIINNEGRTS
jgi:hypothetical protein